MEKWKPRIDMDDMDDCFVEDRATQACYEKMRAGNCKHGNPQGGNHDTLCMILSRNRPVVNIACQINFQDCPLHTEKDGE
ncbi:MAG: hypothetical protein GY906_17955 [bacterium]|nr:hypothetical protein [bacterium]